MFLLNDEQRQEENKRTFLTIFSDKYSLFILYEIADQAIFNAVFLRNKDYNLSYQRNLFARRQHIALTKQCPTTKQWKLQSVILKKKLRLGHQIKDNPQIFSGTRAPDVTDKILFTFYR